MINKTLQGVEAMNQQNWVPALAARWAIRVAIGIAVFWLLIIVFRFETIRWIYGHIAIWLSVNLDIDDRFAALVAMGLTALSIPLIPYFTSFLLWGKRTGAVSVIALVVVGIAFGLLWAFGGEVFFTSNGYALRCWTITPAGIKVIARAADTEKCPVERTYSLQTFPMTSDIAPSVLAARRGKRPVAVSPEDVARTGYFDSGTGEAKVWFKAARNRTFDMFSGPGFHPRTQQPLEPVTPRNVGAIEEYVAQEVQRTARQRQEEDAKRERQAAEELKRVADARAEEERRASAARADQERRAAEERAIQEKRALDARNSADLGLASQQFQSGNLMAASQYVNAVLARDPNNQLANQYSANWRTSTVCSTCGTILRVWDEVVTDDRAIPGAVVGGAAGYAVGRNAGGGRGRDFAPAIGAFAGAIIGGLVSRQTIRRVEVNMDTGQRTVYSFGENAMFQPGQRVAVVASGQQVNITTIP